MKIKSTRLKRKAPHLNITCDLPIFKPFITLLANVIERHPKVFSITLNYSNADYTAETGGYRPVEIRIERKQDNRWYICYVTEFTYMATPFGQESTYAIDFDFSRGLGYQLGMAPEPIAAYGPLYSLWQRNFCRYHSHDVYQYKTRIEEA
ncbi:DUF2787 family protein [Budvicia aquatica]|uniref:Protein of uncharacterized function (DUF2787) n=1 Tax=Budvicia aquatica TaxID=82979 RepID=A0A2C6DNA9_9GAMM|nr:DUF2787 family protein [Budvicia aquatica]PHI30183.1 hypothetical protein CRN84_12955 [Budvicia aquatica]VFS49221.1 Protein of uncharacterised function (DUF2787) [Budvicia aquatica]